MKRLLTALVLALAGMGAFWAGPAAAAICPTTVNTNSDCGFIFTVNPGGNVTGALVPGANPYDGSDDALIGIVNDSSSTYTGTLSLSGSGNGGGLFAFDGDGICIYTSASYCSSAPTGYEGPTTVFSNIGGGGTSGQVSFTGGIAAGASSFFSLEGDPSSISSSLGGGTSGGGTGVPEPATLAILGAGLLGLGLARRRTHYPMRGRIWRVLVQH